MTEKQISIAIEFLGNTLKLGSCNYDQFSTKGLDFIKIGNGNIFTLVQIVILSISDQYGPIDTNHRQFLSKIAEEKNCVSYATLVLTLNEDSEIIQGSFQE